VGEDERSVTALDCRSMGAFFRLGPGRNGPRQALNGP
jgi:hypothetical protein